MSGDGLAHTFTLRTGVPFHNGDSLDTDDVAASLSRWGRAGTYGASVYRNVDSVAAAGTDTVVMKPKTQSPLRWRTWRS